MTHRHDEWDLVPLEPARLAQSRQSDRKLARANCPLWVSVLLMIAAGVVALWGGFLGLAAGGTGWHMIAGALPGVAVIVLIVWWFGKE